MNLLGRFSIRARLYFGMVFSLALLLAIGGMGYGALDRTRSTLQELLAQRVQALTDMADLRTTLGALRLSEKQIILNYNNVVEVADQRQAWAKTLADLRKQMAGVRTAQAGDADFVKALDAAGAEITSYEQGIQPVFTQIENVQLDGAGGAAYAARLQPHVVGADQLLSGLAEEARAQMQAAGTEMEERTTLLSTWIAASLVLGLLVLVPLTLASVGSITRSLAQARELAERIASGDLSRDVAPMQPDEVGQLVDAMARMQGALRSLVQQVQGAAGNITTASGEIALGNHDLSQRTERTAANLEEAASSMELLASTVRSSSESSGQARGVAASAVDVAARGGQVFAQVVSTMEGITRSSRQIAEITGVIDSIAFQTNILALNAAVEAARAGEQGRGFAVVAGEVRTLAQRSAQAAKEIKALIGSSVQGVESGARLVDQAGQTMSDLVSSVQKVSVLISEITTASAEQSDNIGQISQSVSHLDQMTQQNAALVEQSTAASESLREQAVQLKQAIGQFRLQDGVHVDAARMISA